MVVAALIPAILVEGSGHVQPQPNAQGGFVLSWRVGFRRSLVRTVKYLVAASLDGKIAREDGSFDCFAAVGDEHVPDYMQAIESFDAVLMGRRTYEVGLNAGVTDPYPRLDTFVFSASMRESPDERVRIVSEPPAVFVRNLKRQPGGAIYLCGGAQLAATLLAAGLIDEIVVKLNPLLVGAGIPLFASIEQPILLELAGTKIYGNGVVLLTYRVNRDGK